MNKTLVRQLNEGVSPIRLLKVFFNPEKKEIGVYFVYAIWIGLLSLIVPVVTQMLVNAVSFGSITHSFVSLIVAVLFCLLFSSFLRVLKSYLIEFFQRRLFDRVVRRTIRTFGQVTEGQSTKEKSSFVHRFYDLVNFQKSGTILIAEGFSLFLQIAIGFVLLAFYHPYLLAFSIILYAGVYFILKNLSFGGVESAVLESKYKLNIGAYLNELAFEKGDPETIAPLISKYFKARTDSFNVILRQSVAAYFLTLAGSAALLALGGYLVIQEQITLGQFVAAELILSGIFSGIIKLPKQLDTYYESAASAGKMIELMGLNEEEINSDLPFEESSDISFYPSALSIGKIFLSLLVFALLFLVIAPWTQTSEGTGKVIAFNPNEREQNIDSPIEGRISQWFVQEGSRVKKGDSIAEILDNDPEILARLKSERDSLSSRLKAAQIGTETSKKNLDRQKILFEKGLSSERAKELAELEYRKLIADEGSASAELARTDVRLSRQSAQLIVANQDGFISKLISGQGGVFVKSGQMIAKIVPDTKSRSVELFISGLDLPLVTEGREVRLRFDGWPALQFSGWPSVAIGTFPGRVVFVDQTDNGKGKFRVLVSPIEHKAWPSSVYLRQGVRAHGWILLNTVSMGYEIWRQFNGFPASGYPHEALELEDSKK